jgi:PBP1b-binding outer membrane lipoprotein LpoB
MKTSLLPAAAVLLAGCSSAPAPAPSPAPAPKGVGNIVRLDPALDALVPKDAIIEKVGGGF